MTNVTIVTTSLAPNSRIVEQAKQIADQLGTIFVKRGGLGVSILLEREAADRLLIVRGDHLTLIDNDIEYSYHPNMLLVRALNVLRGQRDVYLDAAGYIPGDSVLDCTAGFGCEATLAAMAVGETGSVTALESEPPLAMLTRWGLSRYPIVQAPIREAMRRVNVVTASYVDYLRGAASRSVDVVYLDPFFGERLEGSEHSVSPLVHFGNPQPLDVASLDEARRVARRCAIVKHPRYEDVPEKLVEMRREVITSSKGHTAYSVIDPLP